MIGLGWIQMSADQMEAGGDSFPLSWLGVVFGDDLFGRQTSSLYTPVQKER